MNQKGIAICFGYKPEWETLPIVNIPDDAIRIRRRIRKNEAMQVFVRTHNAVVRCVVGPTSGSIQRTDSLELLYAIGSNVRN